MGKATGQSMNLSGKIGQMVYVKRKNGQTVVYEAPAKVSTPLRTEAQMQQRMQFTNLAAVNTQFHQTLKKGFEGIGNQMSDYNAFVQANANVVRVYVPKQVRLNGGCVLAPYQITRGKLPSIVLTKDGEDRLVTDIALGGLVITEATTVAEFSAAVLMYNEGYEAGDQVTFFYGVQTVDQVTHIPRAKITGAKVVLDLQDGETALWDVTGSLGFASVGGYLGMSGTIVDGAAAWIHSRENASGLSVSTQFLYVDSSVLAAYQTDEAFAVSAESYGGVNTSAVFLQPRGNVVRGAVASQSGGSTGGSSSTGGGTSGDTEGTGGSTGGGESGGSTSGNGTTDSTGGGGTETGGNTGGGTETPGGGSGGNTGGNGGSGGGDDGDDE